MYQPLADLLRPTNLDEVYYIPLTIKIITPIINGVKGVFR